jgi:hypothetical protein
MLMWMRTTPHGAACTLGSGYCSLFIAYERSVFTEAHTTANRSAVLIFGAGQHVSPENYGLNRGAFPLSEEPCRCKRTAPGWSPKTSPAVSSFLQAAIRFSPLLTKDLKRESTCKSTPPEFQTRRLRPLKLASYLMLWSKPPMMSSRRRRSLPSRLLKLLVREWSTSSPRLNSGMTDS